MQEEESNMRRKKVVLIAEDDPSLRKALTIVLEQEFEIHTAENGKIAWDILRKQKIDCLITDIDMPEMSGLELIRNIRNKGYHINIIVTSGTGRPGIRKDCETLGVINYLMKPFNMVSLKKIINANEEPFITQS